MRRLFTIVSVAFLPGLVVGQQPVAFPGAWRLVSYEAPDSNGRVHPVWGDKPLGLIIYQSDGTMAAQLFDERRPPLLATEERAGREAARAAAFDGLAAYYGTYTVDTVGRQVTHHIEGAWVTDWIRHDVVRAYRFLDRDHVELRVVSNADGRKVPRGAALVWERVRR